MRSRSFVVIAALAVTLAGCGGKGGGGLSPTASPSKSATPRGSSGSPSSGGGKLRMMVRALTPGKSLEKPAAKAHIAGSQFAQFLAYPPGTTAGDTLQIRVPPLSSGSTRAVAEIVRNGKAVARTGVTLTAAPGTQITSVRYTCVFSATPSYCPVTGQRSNGAFVIRTSHIAHGPMLLIAATSKSATPSSPKSPSSAAAQLHLLTRAVTPGKPPQKPAATAHVGGSKFAQFLASSTGTTAGDRLRVRIPPLSGGSTHATAQIVRHGKAIASSSATLTASPGPRIDSVRYVCVFSDAPTYCPVKGNVSGGAFVIRTSRIVPGPMSLLVSLSG